MQSLLRTMARGRDEGGKGETFNVEYDVPKHYERRWGIWCKDRETVEGQSLVLVAFDSSNMSIGFSSFAVSLTHGRLLDLRISLDMAYVLPGYRKQGFGIDLSVAAGLVCGDVLAATYASGRSGSTINPVVLADFESRGGERFTMQVKDQLEYVRDMLVEDGGKRSVTISDIELDAGY